MRRFRVFVLLAVTCGLLTAQPVPERAAALIPEFEKNLKENIAAFWYPRCLDRTHGGYTIHFGPKGEPRGDTNKMIVTQARTVWLFARMARAGYGGREMLDAAEHGYRFLREKMWDHANGGFYWEVDPAGDRKTRDHKHLYGQSFGLYAVSEYYLATGRKDVLDFATRIFDVLEARSHDKKHGGYIEFFRPDWTEPAPGTASYMGGAGTDRLKLMNTHLHLMEAMTTFYRASRLPLARERLLELMTIESNAVVRKGLTACTDKYDRDWTPRLEGDFARVSYGHDLENVWLLVDAADAAGVPNSPLLDLYRELFAYSLQYGYDQAEGGFYDTGAFRKPADQRSKIWWVQAEALVSALTMYKLTGDPTYWRVFEKTWEFTNKRQTDWEYGEWHATILPDGTARGDKANAWKGGYHNGRAMIECLAILKQLSGK